MNTATRPEAAALAEVPAYNPPAPAAGSTSSIALLMDDRSMDKLMRVADMMASARATVPKHFRGNPGDCLAVCMQAATWNMNPFAVAQKTFLVGDSGTLGYEAQLVSAVINNSGAVKDRFHFEWYGPWERVIGKFTVKRSEKGEYRVPGWSMADEEGCGIRVWATIKGETEPRELSLLLAQARVRNSTLWADDPKQQLAYLAQKRWARLYAPDVILGVYTPDEFEQPAPVDMGRADVVQTAGASLELVDRAEAAAAQGMKQYQAFWAATTPADRKALTAAGHHDRLKSIASQADAERTVDTAPAFPPMPEPEQPAGKSFEEVMQMLCSAKTEEALYVAADWVAGDDQEQVRLLDAKFQERLVEIRGE
jgi:hypothetical protein